MKGDVNISYCVVDRQLVHVSNFAHLSTKGRPLAYCPECAFPLVLELGSEYAHHAAHKATNPSCILTTNEGALHFNSKMYIAEQLQRGKRLHIKKKCIGWTFRDNMGKTLARWNECQLFEVESWVADWDEVHVEKRFESLRPDIMLSRKGKTIAAIEIFVTNPVDDVKRRKYRDAEIPWLEVKGDELEFAESVNDGHSGYFENESAWKIEKPISHHGCFPPPDVWICPECIKAPAEYRTEMAEMELRRQSERIEAVNRQRQEIARRRKYFDPRNNHFFAGIAFEVVRANMRQRYELIAVERYALGPPFELEELYIRNGHFDCEILFSIEPIIDGSKALIEDYLKDYIEVACQNSEEIIEITNGWVSEDEFNRTVNNSQNPYSELLTNIDESLRRKVGE